MTTELLTDPGHTREDMRLMEQAVKRSVKNPEIPIPPAIIEAMPKVAGTILLKGEPREQLRAGALLLAFLEYNKSLNPPEPQHTPPTVVNVGVNVDNRTESKPLTALQFAQRYREAKLLEHAESGAT